MTKYSRAGGRLEAGSSETAASITQILPTRTQCLMPAKFCLRQHAARDTYISTDMPSVHLQILEANFQVELAGAGHDVLARLLDGAHDHGVALGQPLEALHQLRQIRRVLCGVVTKVRNMLGVRASRGSEL